MLAAESKVNQLEGKSQDAANQALEMKKIVESSQLDLVAKKKDDKYQKEISDAAAGKPLGSDGKPAKAGADGKDAKKGEGKKPEVKKEDAKKADEEQKKDDSDDSDSESDDDEKDKKGNKQSKEEKKK